MRDLLWLAIPMMCYALQAATVYAVQGRWGMVVCFSGYIIGNIGLMLDLRGI